MSILSVTRSAWADYPLAFFRIVAGIVFISVGTMKVVGYPPSPVSGPAIALMSQLGIGGLIETVGGILIVPVGRDPTAQVVERIVKSESGLQRDTLMPVRFVPLVTGALPVLGQG